MVTWKVIADYFYKLQETEAQLSLSKAEELAKAELTSAIAKEKAALIEKMTEADLNVSIDETLYFIFYSPPDARWNQIGSELT